MGVDELDELVRPAERAVDAGLVRLEREVEDRLIVGLLSAARAGDAVAAGPLEHRDSGALGLRAEVDTDGDHPGTVAMSRRGGHDAVMTLIARFAVTGAEPDQGRGLDADWVGMLVFSKTFSSGIVGSATTLFMSAGTRRARGRTSRLSRSVAEPTTARKGSFVVQHGGLESDREHLVRSHRPERRDG